MIAQSFILLIISMVNILFLAVPPILIYSLIRFEGFRAWVRESIENGDQVAHTRDAKNAVILFFAFVIGWIDVDVMLGMLLFKQDWLTHWGAVTALFLALLGLSQWQGSKN